MENELASSTMGALGTAFVGGGLFAYFLRLFEGGFDTGDPEAEAHDEIRKWLGFLLQATGMALLTPDTGWPPIVEAGLWVAFLAYSLIWWQRLREYDRLPASAPVAIVLIANPLDRYGLQVAYAFYILSLIVWTVRSYPA